MSTNWYVGLECKVQDREGNWHKGTIKAIKRGRARVVTLDEDASFWVDSSEKHRILPKKEAGGIWADNDYGLKGYQKAQTRGELLSVAMHNRQLNVSVETTSTVDGVVWYTVRVDTGKHVWESDHRYSEFRKLYDMLSNQKFIPDEIVIPPKTWHFHENSQEIVTERTLSFDEFLNKVIRVEDIQYCMDLIRFLSVHPERDVESDIKDVNKAFEMGLMSFRQSKLLESRPDLIELLFGSIPEGDLSLGSDNSTPGSDDPINSLRSMASDQMNSIQAMDSLPDTRGRAQMARKSCMEELFKEHADEFNFHSVDYDALSNHIVIDFSKTKADRLEEEFEELKSELPNTNSSEMFEEVVSSTKVPITNSSEMFEEVVSSTKEPISIATLESSNFSEFEERIHVNRGALNPSVVSLGPDEFVE